jgi:hypothetical protein
LFFLSCSFFLVLSFLFFISCSFFLVFLVLSFFLKRIRTIHPQAAREELPHHPRGLASFGTLLFFLTAQLRFPARPLGLPSGVLLPMLRTMVLRSTSLARGFVGDRGFFLLSLSFCPVDEAKRPRGPSDRS